MDAAPESRRLDAEQERTWIALASLVLRLPRALDRQLQRDAGLSHFEYLCAAWSSIG